MSSLQRQPTFPTTPIYEQCHINHGVPSMRLVELLPGTVSQPIICRLSSHLLSTKLEYTALSYVWGDSTFLQPISVNGRLFGVTSNLHAALVYLRQPHISKIIWVDAICIDQDDIRERNHQVSLMKSIYEAASDVVAWLGEAEDNSDEAMDYLASGSWANEEKAVVQPDLARALDKLWARMYWTRVWVVQELAMARQVSIWCGRKYIPITAVMEYLSWKRLSGLGNTSSPAWIPRKMLLLTKSVDSNVIFILRDSWHLQATQNLDKIYGLLALFPEEFSRHLEPNYMKTFAELMYDVVKSYLHTYGDLDILCIFRQLNNVCNEWTSPSWLPNISHAFLGMYEAYNACGSRRTAEATIFGKSLRAKGVVLSKITFAQERFMLKHEFKTTSSLKAKLAEMRNRSMELLEQQFPKLPDEQREKLFFDMLAGDRAHSQSTKLCPYSCQQLWDKIFSIQTKAHRRQLRDVIQFFGFMFLRLTNRCFFVTADGYIGLGPPHTIEGDIVCIIYGCRLPVVLKRVDGVQGQLKYRFSGPAYVVGAMSGEFVGTSTSSVTVREEVVFDIE